jgi:uncharacterized protein (DUF983 family)
MCRPHGLKNRRFLRFTYSQIQNSVPIGSRTRKPLDSRICDPSGLAVGRLRCPFCLEGQVFSGWFNALRRCDRCGYFFSRESGYFGGSIYFGYGVTLLVVLVVGLLLGYVFGMGWSLAVLAPLLAITLVFPIWFFRYARILWMCLDLYLNPPVTEGFEAKGR